MKSEFPNWAAFTPAFVREALSAALADAEQGIAALEGSNPTTFGQFVGRLDDMTRPVTELWGRVAHMLGVMNDEAWRKIEEDFQPQVVAFSLRVGQSPRLYELAKAIAAGETDPTRRRILAKMVQTAELSGVALEGAAKARFNEIQMTLAKLGSDFHNAVIDATKAFTFAKDGKTYTIDDANYPETMKNCADRDVREVLYRARSTRAPENAVRIGEILKLRQEMATLLGFTDYAELSLATKCAPSVAAVLKMYDDLDAATVARAEDEERELGTDLKPWDRAFAAERLREKKYAYSEDELKRHFELEQTLAGLFRMANFLFGIDVVEMTGTEKPSVWHPDVRFFAVREAGATIAHFYFDPYVRNGLKSGGAWMNEFRNRRVIGGGASDVSAAPSPPTVRTVTPLALVATNFPLPDADGKCLLPFREVETLFHEFGHALQCMLTRIDDEDAAGINLVEWDAVEVASQFMENWCLDDRTGIVVPDDLKAKVRAAKNFRAASVCRRQLALGKTDFTLHVASLAAGRTPTAIKEDTFDHFGMPYLPDDRFLCAFTHIFAGGYAAGYYGYKWAEVMSADCYGAFEDAGLQDDAAVRRVGRRYRETVLGLGGSKSALDVFREFRGRDPEIKALLRQQDLL